MSSNDLDSNPKDIQFDAGHYTNLRNQPISIVERIVQAYGILRYTPNEMMDLIKTYPYVVCNRYSGHSVFSMTPDEHGGRYEQSVEDVMEYLDSEDGINRRTMKIEFVAEAAYGNLDVYGIMDAVSLDGLTPKQVARYMRFGISQTAIDDAQAFIKHVKDDLSHSAHVIGEFI